MYFERKGGDGGAAFVVGLATILNLLELLLQSLHGWKKFSKMIKNRKYIPGLLRGAMVMTECHQGETKGTPSSRLRVLKRGNVKGRLM